jgi:CelD/BcsL family acetyltransferase involved in cellulose biosynthesis
LGASATARESGSALTGPTGAGEIAALAERALAPNVFAEPALADAFAAATGAAVEIATARVDGRLAAVLPVLALPASPMRPLPTLTARLHEYTVLSAPLLAPEDPEAAWAGLLDALAERPGPRLLALPFLPGGPALDALQAACRASGRRLAALDAYERARVDRMEGGAAAYLARRFPNKDKRKRWRQERAKLEASGPLALARSRGEAAPAAFERFLALEAAGWKGRGGTAVLSSPADAAFMRGAVASLSRRGGAEVFELTAGDELAAAGLVLRSGRGAWFHKIAYDESLERAGPGAVLAHELTLVLLDDPGVAFVDSCVLRGGGMLAHAWPDAQRIADVMVSLDPGPSWRFEAAVAAERLRRRARAEAKRAYHALRGAAVRRGRAAAGG